MDESYKLDRYPSQNILTESPTFQKVKITNKSKKSHEAKIVCDMIKNMLSIREKYQKDMQTQIPKYSLEEIADTKNLNSPPRLDTELSLKDGVYHVRTRNEDGDEEEREVISRDEFFGDLADLMKLVSKGAAKSLAYNRLKILCARFDLHVILNDMSETEEVKMFPHKDFYNIIKVDNHVHHSACMNQKQFLRFVKRKVRTESSVIVTKNEDGKEMSLGEVAKSLGISQYNLSIDYLDMHAHKQTFHRFDKFNQKYNPVGSSLLRSIFLKTSNYINGRYLSELTKEVFEYLEEQKYQFNEYRLSIYGKKRDEWRKLSEWIVDNDLVSSKNVWMIQIPRLFEIYKANKLLNSFQDMLSNIFQPIFEATLDPQSHPKIFKFLQLIGGFDTVDDESVLEIIDYKTKPQDWDHSENPSYAVYAYYIYANVSSLNRLRKSRGLNTFSFRPHSGESGSIEHLATTYLLANSINHGILLHKTPLLCYLYYLSQIGLSISPLSNNILFVRHKKHPFPYFFRVGLNCTLSTDDPLMIHFTKDPLIEEYSVAAQIWRLSKTDLSEIAANSVYQSSFDERIKAKWYGKNHGRYKINKSICAKKNLSAIRIAFRKETFDEEMSYINGQ